jgi:type I restriction enzyme S subunit
MKLRQYPKYKESGVKWIETIPEGWKIAKLKFEDSIVMGQSPDSENYNYENKGVPFLQGNAEFTKLYPKPVVWCENAPKKALENDILLSVRAPVGALNIADQKYGIGRGLCAIRCKKSFFKFLFYQLIIREAELNSVGTGSTYVAISTDDVSNLSLIVPSKDEQIQIAEYLDWHILKFDELIEESNKLIELLKEKRSALINQVVTKGLDLKAKLKNSGIDWIGKIPENWEMRKLSHIAKKICVGFVGSIEKHYTESQGGVILLKTGNVGYGQILLDDVSHVTKEFHKVNKKSQLNPGDLVIARHGESGRSAVIPPEIAVSNCLNVVLLKSSSTMSGEYYSYLLNSHAVQEHLQAIQGGSVQGVINTEDLSSLKVTYPPLQEQIQIATYLDSKTLELDITIEKVQKSIKLLEEYKKSLINNVVTGKIDVRFQN